MDAVLELWLLNELSPSIDARSATDLHHLAWLASRPTFMVMERGDWRTPYNVGAVEAPLNREPGSLVRTAWALVRWAEAAPGRAA